MKSLNATLPLPFSRRLTRKLRLLALAGLALAIPSCAPDEDELSGPNAPEDSFEEPAASEDSDSWSPSATDETVQKATSNTYMFFFLNVRRLSGPRGVKVSGQAKGSWRTKRIEAYDSWYNILPNAARVIEAPRFKVKAEDGYETSVSADCDGEVNRTPTMVLRWSNNQQVTVQFEYMCTTPDPETCSKVRIEEPIVSTFGDVVFGVRWAPSCGGLRRQLAQHSKFVGVFDRSDATGDFRLFTVDDLKDGASVPANTASLVTVPKGAPTIHLFDYNDCRGTRLYSLTSTNVGRALNLTNYNNRADSICAGSNCNPTGCNL